MKRFIAIQSITIVAFALVAVVLGAGTSACANHAPPNLTPAATSAWYGTRVIKDLDVLRDTAIDANNQTPPLLNRATTARVVLYHKAAIKTVHAAPNGWKATVSTGLDSLADSLTLDEKAILAPYLALAKAALQEIP